MPGNDSDYFGQRRRDEAAIAARQRKAMERRATEQLGAAGALYSGQRQKTMAGVEQDYMAEYRKRMMGVAEQEEAARQAGLGREHQSGMQQAGFGQQTSMQETQLGHEWDVHRSSQEFQMGLEQYRTQAQEHFLNMGYDHESASQAAELAGREYENEQQRQFEAWGLQAGFGQQASMLDLENQWRAYHDVGGYGHELGMAGFTQGFQSNVLQNQQEYDTYMAQFGFQMDQMRNRWQTSLNQLGYNAQYATQRIAQEASGGVGSVIGSIVGGVAGSFAGGFGASIGANIGSKIGGS